MEDKTLLSFKTYIKTSLHQKLVKIKFLHGVAITYSVKKALEEYIAKHYPDIDNS